MRLITAAEWRGADCHPVRSGTVRHAPPPGIEVHHSVTGRARDYAGSIAMARSIYRGHVRPKAQGGRGWSDIFYCYLVTDTYVVECRGIGGQSQDDVPWTTVCFIGDYEHVDVPWPGQLAHASELRRLVLDHHGGREVRTHHQRVPSDQCPGRNLLAVVGTIGIAGAAHSARPVGLVIPDRPYPGVARLGDRGHGVLVWQQALRERGQALAVDGVYGPQTRDVVHRWQARHHMSVDGVAGPATWHTVLFDPAP